MVERQCRYEPLRQQPLVLVLCQVRFSPIRRIGDYISDIQEDFRQAGFPLEEAGKVQQVIVTPMGLKTVEQERWAYRTKDERWSVTILQDSLALQTTAYDRFEGFAEHLERALTTVLKRTEHDRLGVVERVGLRYIDLIRPREGEDHRHYLRPGFHGAADAAFAPASHRVFVESVGRTSVGTDEGTMILRVAQNDQGFDLPPDLIAGAPKHERRAQAGELITLVDMDHFVEARREPEVPRLIETTYALHDHLIETFHDHVVTREAIEAWR